nr:MULTISPECIES: S1 RNA-binding domain-containing protein [Streptomyces]
MSASCSGGAPSTPPSPSVRGPPFSLLTLAFLPNPTDNDPGCRPPARDRPGPGRAVRRPALASAPGRRLNSLPASSWPCLARPHDRTDTRPAGTPERTPRRPGEALTGTVAGFDGGDVLVLLDGDAPGLPSGRVPGHELTWRDVRHPSDVFTVGQRIRAQVTMRGGHDGRTPLSARACEDEALYGFLLGLGARGRRRGDGVLRAPLRGLRADRR